MKKSRKKFLEGGKIHNYVEDPTKALYDNNLMIDKAIIQASQDTELMRTIGDSLIGLSSQVPGAVNGFKKTFRTGGKVPVEIEGQEVVETPAGQLFQAQGPSHENGGIDLSLPEGTDIFFVKEDAFFSGRGVTYLFRQYRQCFFFFGKCQD